MPRIRDVPAITLAAVLGLKRMVVLARHKYIPYDWLEKKKKGKKSVGRGAYFGRVGKMGASGIS